MKMRSEYYYIKVATTLLSCTRLLFYCKLNIRIQDTGVYSDSYRLVRQVSVHTNELVLFFFPWTRANTTSSYATPRIEVHVLDMQQISLTRPDRAILGNAKIKPKHQVLVLGANHGNPYSIARWKEKQDQPNGVKSIDLGEAPLARGGRRASAASRSGEAPASGVAPASVRPAAGSGTSRLVWRHPWRR
jgi:hypothetical protein